MADDTVLNVQARFGALQIGESMIGLSPIPMPVVYFDNAPSLSHLNGIIGVTLAVTGNVPGENGTVQSVASVVAYLKCNIPAAHALIGALQAALLLARPVENPEGQAN